MKFTTNDILAVLRRFSIANDDNVPRHIDRIEQFHPSPINQLIKFRFNKSQYFMLIDETAEDNINYINEQIHVVDSNTTGELLENPTDSLTTFGLPFKGKDVYLFKQISDKKRLDVFLAQKYPETSRNTWQKYIKAGYVAVNKELIDSPKHEISETDDVAINIPPGDNFDDKEMPIIYLDDNVIVVNKPAGVLTHSKGVMNNEFTVADFFRRYTSVDTDTNRPGIVHRLDRDTSGVIIGARTQESAHRLKKQFSNRKAKKTYLAIVEGTPKQSAAQIDIPIGRNPSSPSTFRADKKGKPATTYYKVIASHNGRSLVLLQPRTGRTHQLRVHMKFINTPIVGDRVYGKAGDRLLLHAYRLEISISDVDRPTFIAPIPKEFREYFPEDIDKCL